MKGGVIKKNAIPRGVEVLVKKAAIDEEFRGKLIAERAEAAKLIELDLDASEISMLNAITGSQLETIISSTKVSSKHRAAFLGYAAAMMLATFGLSSAASGCAEEEFEYETTGIDPDLEYLDEIPPDESEEAEDTEETGSEEDTIEEETSEIVDESEEIMISRGVRPDKP